MKNSACLMLMLLAACGGGGNDNDYCESIRGPQTLTGRFIDSPVEGLRYISYNPRIADADWPIEDKGRTFRNLLRFIQTLDVDGDPNNGIRLATIPTDVFHEAYPSGSTDMYIDVFDVDESEFENDDAILTIIGRVTNTSNLVDTQTAVEHFNNVIADLPDYVDPRLSW